MTALVLVLATMLPRDAGPGAGSASEPVVVRVKLGNGFAGFLRVPGGPLRRVKFQHGNLDVRYAEDEGKIFLGCTLTGDGANRFRLTWGDSVYQGTVYYDGRRVILTLNPGPERAGLLPETVRVGAAAKH